jgi:hypothetical protein
MPSPFPGMDPYLEGSLWGSVHTQLSVEIARQLTPLLLPRYVVLTEKRFVVVTPDADDAGRGAPALSLYPDAGLTSVRPDGSAVASGSATIAPLRIATVMPELAEQVTVEIVESSSRKLVTAIEVLSPANKRGDGREEYLRRRRQYLLSDAHLMEIDLLRAGERVPMRQRLPSVPYFVFLSRVEARPWTDVWPVPLDAALPKVPVPLRGGDPDVDLNLQLALTAVYDSFGYAAMIDYARAPEPPLDAEQSTWALARLGGTAARP